MASSWHSLKCFNAGAVDTSTSVDPYRDLPRHPQAVQDASFAVFPLARDTDQRDCRPGNDHPATASRIDPAGAFHDVRPF